VCDVPIQTAKFQEHGKLVAVGARDGSTTLIELSDGMSKMQKNEKNIFSAVSTSRDVGRRLTELDAGS
jgi:dynein intermediate chain 2